jgi:hypothetical protein
VEMEWKGEEEHKKETEVEVDKEETWW